MPTKILDVTAEDILFGLPHKTCGCPVSRAANRAFGTTVSVGLTHIVIHGGPVIDTPYDMRAWIILYDNAQPVEPRKFEVRW